MAISSEYVEQYKLMHESNEGMFPGQQTIFVKDYIKNMIDLYGCSTVIDYGCGKGFQYTAHNVHSDWGVTVNLYDIGVSEFSNKPAKNFDMLISTDVLEHCETDYIPEILQELNNYADKCVLVSIATRLAKKTLPDGRNAHLTVQPSEWWMEQISAVATKPWLILFENQVSIDKTRKFDIKHINIDEENVAKLMVQ